MFHISTIVRSRTFFFLILTALSFLIHFHIPAYLETGNQLLKNSTFSAGDTDWKIRHNSKWSKTTVLPNHAIISSPNIPQNVKISQSIDRDKLNTKVILKATLKSRDILHGTLSFNKGRVLLLQYKNNSPAYAIPHKLIAIDKSNDWETYESIFFIQPDIEKVEVILQLSNATGELHCKDITLYNAIDNPLYAQLRIALFTAWGIFGLVLISPYMRNINARSRFLLCLITFTLLFGITMSGSLKNDLKQQIRHAVKTSIQHPHILKGTQNWSPKDNNPQTKRISSQSLPTHQEEKPFALFTYIDYKLDITKMAHLLLFMCLGVLLKRNRARTTCQVVMDLLLLACITEMLQLFIEGRSALFKDIGIDFLGGLSGVIGHTILARTKKPGRNQNNLPG